MSPGQVAPVTSGSEAAPPPQDQQVKLRLAWGLSLFVASAIVMLIDSAYLTFIAHRAAEKS